MSSQYGLTRSSQYGFLMSFQYGASCRFGPGLRFRCAGCGLPNDARGSMGPEVFMPLKQLARFKSISTTSHLNFLTPCHKPLSLLVHLTEQCFWVLTWTGWFVQPMLRMRNQFAARSYQVCVEPLRAGSLNVEVGVTARLFWGLWEIRQRKLIGAAPLLFNSNLIDLTGILLSQT